MIVVSEEVVPIISQEGNICVQFGHVQIRSRGGFGGRVTSIFPCVDLILDYCLGS